MPLRLSMRHVLHGAFEQMGEHTRWRATPTEHFTLSSTISYLNRQQSSSLNHGISARTQGICFKIWKLKEVMPRVKLFIWRTVVDALLVAPSLRSVYLISETLAHCARSNLRRGIICSFIVH
uniref:Uncharacterized protein n=1 Tax=Ananas comosus var. bracteatus TaxID=296719 RepID=A0A6V7PX24_ANACO|nr:unnamed protein product [Ananas comosus var. bracteatus]